MANIMQRLFLRPLSFRYEERFAQEMKAWILSFPVRCPRELAGALQAWARSDFLQGPDFRLASFVEQHYGASAVQWLPEAIRIGINEDLFDVWSMSKNQVIRSVARPSYFLTQGDPQLREGCLKPGMQIQGIAPLRLIVGAVALIVLILGQALVFHAGAVSPSYVWISALLAVSILPLLMLTTKEGRVEVRLLVADILNVLRFLVLALPVRVVLALGKCFRRSATLAL